MFYEKNTAKQVEFVRCVRALIGEPIIVCKPWTDEEICRLKKAFKRQDERVRTRESYRDKKRTKKKADQIRAVIASLPDGYPYEQNPITGELVPFELDSDLYGEGYDVLAVLPSRINQAIKIGQKGWSASGKKFIAEISVCGRQFKLGRFDTAEDARAVYLWAKSVAVVLLAEAYKKHLLESDYLALMLVSGRVNG